MFGDAVLGWWQEMRDAPVDARLGAAKVGIPPIKTQGIKTKLVNFILANTRRVEGGRWIEPFLGSGVVMFNAASRNAIGAETNMHIINFYRGVQSGRLTPAAVRRYLEIEGLNLQKRGAAHYYEVRDRFNRDFEPLDFLFLNRAGFNGLMRFNSKGKFNVPFCKKTSRFSKSYITKITNQVLWIMASMKAHRAWEFRVSDWRETLQDVGKTDFVYLDPPYSGRSANYYDLWEEGAMQDLAEFLKCMPCRFALSLWCQNRYRKNPDLSLFKDYQIKTMRHFYHLGSTENLRNSMVEALIIKNVP